MGIKGIDDLREDLGGFLVEVGDGNAGGQCGIVGVVGGQVGSSLGRQVVELDCGDALVHALDDLVWGK